MDKKIYNQMGFDFGDGDPAQESPAAGFRIKTLKPASKADTGESEQETDNQENLTTQSGENGEQEPAQSTAITETSGNGPSDSAIEQAPGKQESESNPTNDSEVIENIPVVAEDETKSTNGPANQEEEQPEEEQEEEKNEPVAATPVAAPPEEEQQQPEETPKEENQEEDTPEEAPKAAEQPTNSPNIPSKLTRPTQVYAVEEEIEEEEPATNKHNDNIGFTPSSEEVGNTPAATKEEAPGETQEEEAANAEQLPVVNNEPVAPTITQSEQPSQSQNTAEEESTPGTTDEPEQLQEDEGPDTGNPDDDVNINNAKSEPAQKQDQETEPAPEQEPGPELPKKSTRGRKSLKALDAEAGAMNIPEDSTLFKRQYYSIGEVAGMFGVNQSLLRFWENEFDVIQPRKNRKGDRHFRPVDIKNLELIYDLLRRRKLTIEGAKEFLKKNRQARERFEMIQSLQQIKGFMLEIKATL